MVRKISFLRKHFIFIDEIGNKMYLQLKGDGHNHIMLLLFCIFYDDGGYDFNTMDISSYYFSHLDIDYSDMKKTHLKIAKYINEENELNMGNLKMRTTNHKIFKEKFYEIFMQEYFEEYHFASDL